MGTEDIYPSDSVKNLGCIFDNTLTMKKQIAETCKSGFFHIRNIARIKRHLPFESNQVLIHAFVTSKLDYCNSLYYGLPDYIIQKLQYVQNRLSRSSSYWLPQTWSNNSHSERTSLATYSATHHL